MSEANEVSPSDQRDRIEPVVICPKTTKKDRENKFWQEAFLRVLPNAFDTQEWVNESGLIENIEDRVDIAKEFADEALNIARRSRRI